MTGLHQVWTLEWIANAALSFGNGVKLSVSGTNNPLWL